MPEIKAIIFDLDGTLIDSVADLANSVNFTLAEIGLPGHTTGTELFTGGLNQQKLEIFAQNSAIPGSGNLLQASVGWRQLFY